MKFYWLNPDNLISEDYRVEITAVAEWEDHGLDGGREYVTWIITGTGDHTRYPTVEDALAAAGGTV